jgi:hypothetical protein
MEAGMATREVRTVLPNAPLLTSAAAVRALYAEYPEMRAKGFRAAVRSLAPGDEDLVEALQGFLPDAHAILPATREVHAVEIVDTSPMGFEKGQMYYHLGEVLGEYDWSLSVVVFNYAGALTCHLPYYYFGRVYTEGFAGRDLRDVVPAAMAAARATGWYTHA